MTKYELAQYKGNFGKQLTLEMTKNEMINNLPSYARVTRKFPDWKQKYIKKSRDFYNDNKKHINGVVAEIAKYPSQSWQKLEWNVGDGERNINNYILQFRASGIRVKKVDFFPSLVCTNTQRPIIGWQKRYITKEEGLKLQSLEGISLPQNDNAAFRALGNDYLGVTLSGQAFRYNLFARSSQKGFPLQSLTQNEQNFKLKIAA